MNKHWKDLSFVAFDTETSGKYPLESQICEIAAVKWQNGSVVDSYQTLIKPDEPMSDFVIKIHNITNEMVENAPKVGEVIGDFREFIEGSVCIAHHAPFDLGFVAPEFEEVGLELPQEPALCTSLLGRKLIRESSNHKLQTLVNVLKIDGGQAHRALDDAKACLEVALECLRRAGEDLTLADVLKIQDTDLSWQKYSMTDLKEEERTANLIKAIRERREVNLTYDGGSRPGKSRVVLPIGIVRNPNGDFLVATENGRQPPKRYTLDKVSASKF